MLVPKNSTMKVRNVKAIPGEEVMSQHRLLVMDVKVKDRKELKNKEVGRVKTWRLKDESVKRELVEKVNERIEKVQVWDDINEVMRKTMVEVCGQSQGKEQVKKWWWNDQEVCKALKENKEAYQTWR
jgi:hypothetical protein